MLDPIGRRKSINDQYLERLKELCKTCRKTFSEQLDFVGTKKGFTHRFAENIVKQVISSNVSNVAKNNGLSDEEVNSMIEDIAPNLLPIDMSNLRRLGIDEISLVKGQGKFIVVLVDIDARKLIGLVKEKKQIVRENFLKTWGEEVF